MSSLEKEIIELQQQNYELVKAAQNWKIVAAEKDKEILKLTKEVNDLRIQISILRNKGSTSARKLEAALQITSERVLSHLVQGSNAVAEMIEHIKSYTMDRKKMENSARQSVVDSTPNTEKVLRVPPLMYGGRSIQPVVSLSRTMLPQNVLTVNQQPNENHNNPVRPVPMRILQEVYIPLTRIDADTNSSNDIGINNLNTSIEDMGLEEDNGDIPDQEHQTTIQTSSICPNLSDVLEESEENITTTLPNPVAGSSQLLDSHNVNRSEDQSMHEFTPTLRQRKRLSSPQSEPSPIFVPRLIVPRHKANGRILKVLVAKMRLDDSDTNDAGVSPPKKQMMAETKSCTEKTDPTCSTAFSPCDKPGPSRDRVWNKAGPSREKSKPLWNKPECTQDDFHLSWKGSESSLEKFRSPWDNAAPSQYNSIDIWNQPGPSRNNHILPINTCDGKSSRDTDYLVGPSQEMSSSQDVQERCCEENSKENNTISKHVTHRPQSKDKQLDTSRDNSPLHNSNSRMSVDSPVKLFGDTARRPRDSPSTMSNFDIYKMSLDSQKNDIDELPIFDAPSPNGSTNLRVIVQEAEPKSRLVNRRDSRISKRSDSTDTSSEYSDDVQEKRTRRMRKPVVYKEIPLNRKLRRSDRC